ncbi:MAG: PD-(D/E)XK nuclease family transposase [Fibrobacteraceae bacterium]|nr:PD-(D/E)XK nuclease family transposase [Fibrobacteraceae bacterium]
MKQKPEENFKIPELLRGKTFLDPTYDAAFQELFSDKRTLIHFLNGILHLDTAHTILNLEYRNPGISIAFPYPKTVRFDIRAITAEGKELDIEMQRHFHSDFNDRAILYSAMLTVGAKIDLDRKVLEMPEEEKVGRYEIPQVISIWICKFCREDFKNFREEWALYKKSDIGNANARPVSDKIEYIFIELPKFEKKIEELENDEDRWLFLLKNMGGEEDRPDFSDKILDSAYERLRIKDSNPELIERQVNDMVTEAEIETRIQDGLRDGRKVGLEQGLKEGKEIGLQQGRELGLQQGKELGLQQGKQQGIKQAKLEMAKALKKQGVSIAIIKSTSGFSENEIRKL